MNYETLGDTVFERLARWAEDTATSVFGTEEYRGETGEAIVSQAVAAYRSAQAQQQADEEALARTEEAKVAMDRVTKVVAGAAVGGAVLFMLMGAKKK